MSGRRYTFNAWGRNQHVTNIKGAVCSVCEGRKRMMARTPQGFESVPCPHCGGTGVVVKGKKR